MKNIKIIIFIISFCLINITYAWVNSNSSYNKVDTSIPNYVGKLAWSYINDINFWKKWVHEQDRNFNEYLVIPSNWLIIPINHIQPSNKNYRNIDKININDYLQNGALSYPWNDSINYSREWNIVIFWHSSYWKSDKGRYKTHFQKIIWLWLWKEIWIFKKYSSWKWGRFKYLVDKSYNTNPKDISVLKYSWKKELTLFTCTPIWWITGRWIVKSTYIAEKINNNKIAKINKRLIEVIIKIEDTTKRNILILKANKILKKYWEDNEVFIKIQKEFEDLAWVRYLLK